MRHLKKDGLLPCISAKLHEKVIDIISIEAAGLDAFNDLVQLSEVFDLQRHVVFFGDARQFTVGRPLCGAEIRDGYFRFGSSRADHERPLTGNQLG